MDTLWQNPGLSLESQEQKDKAGQSDGLQLRLG